MDSPLFRAKNRPDFDGVVHSGERRPTKGGGGHSPGSHPTVERRRTYKTERAMIRGATDEELAELFPNQPSV